MNIPAFYRYLNIFKYQITRLLNVQYYSIVDLLGRVGSEGERLYVNSYYAYRVQSTSQREGATYVYVTTQDKSSHNGITVISDTVPWAGTQATLSDFLAGTGETDPSGTGCWVMNFEGYLTPAMAGAVGGGSTDDTTAITKAIAVLGARTYGGVLRLEDFYKVTATIENSANSVYIVGQGWGTGFTRSGDYGDTIYFHGNNTTGSMLQNFGFSNFKLISTGKTTSGAQLRVNGCAYGSIDTIYIQDGYVGMQFDGAGQIFINNPFILINNLFGGTSSGRRYMAFGNATGSYSHPSSGGIWINNFQMRGPNPLTASQNVVQYGVHIESSDGLWFSNGHVGNCELANYSIQKTSSELLALVYFENAFSDEGAGYGLLIDSTVARIADVKFSNCTFKGAGFATYGVYVPSTCSAYRIQFINCSITEYDYHGVYIRSSEFRKSSFVNCVVSGNSQAGDNLYPAYEFDTNVRDVDVIGGMAGWEQITPGDAGTHNYGFKLNSGHSNINIAAVDVTKNLTASWTTPLPSGVSIVNCPNTFLSVSHTQDFQVNGKFGMGTVPGASNVLFNKDISGATTYYNQINRATVKSDVTTAAIGLYNAVNTEAAAFTLSTYTAFLAGQETIGAGSTVNNLIGFNASSSLSGGSSSYGFRSDIASANGKWNFYAQGTARNFMAGRLDVAGTARTGSVAPSLTNPTNFYSADSTFTDGNTAASGTVAHVPVNAFNNPALAATNATVTYTNASTVYIDGAPTAGTNITITNPYSLYVNGGSSYFGGEVNTTDVFKVDGTQVVGNRVTGWTADSGTDKRTANTTYSGTAEGAYTQATIQALMDAVKDQSQTIKALKDDLITHGLIGS